MITYKPVILTHIAYSISSLILVKKLRINSTIPRHLKLLISLTNQRPMTGPLRPNILHYPLNLPPIQLPINSKPQTSTVFHNPFPQQIALLTNPACKYERIDFTM